MSVEFSNAYQEILFDNLMSIIKQNFVFQTQLKLAEDVGKGKTELQNQYNELLAKYNSIESEIKNIESYKAKANVNDSAHQEKQRIQSALNDQMKKNTGLIKELEDKNQEIEKLKEYVLKLEEIAPTSKLKKINPEKVVTKEPESVVVEPAPADLFKVLTDGSAF
jgi:predicted RNase H-like nuclease (RuvC/YqgF family)